MRQVPPRTQASTAPAADWPGAQPPRTDRERGGWPGPSRVRGSRATGTQIRMHAPARISLSEQAAHLEAVLVLVAGPTSRNTACPSSGCFLRKPRSRISGFRERHSDRRVCSPLALVRNLEVGLYGVMAFVVVRRYNELGAARDRAGRGGAGRHRLGRFVSSPTRSARNRGPRHFDWCHRPRARSRAASAASSPSRRDWCHRSRIRSTWGRCRSLSASGLSGTVTNIVPMSSRSSTTR